MIDDKLLELLAQKLKSVAQNLQIMQQGNLYAKLKTDYSIVTNADYESHRQIIHILQQLTPDIPIISEEGDIPDYEKRKQFNLFWLVDPLDGTKSYYEKSSEYAICIALIAKTDVIFGLIYDVEQQTYYYAIKGEGAYKVDNFGQKSQITVADSSHTNRVVIGSSTKLSPKLTKILDKKLCKYQIKQVASAIKFTLIAQGKQDFYINLSGCCEWDTAAGVCLVNEAGGVVLKLEDDSKLTFNNKNLKGSSFYCSNFKR